MPSTNWKIKKKRRRKLNELFTWPAPAIAVVVGLALLITNTHTHARAPAGFRFRRSWFLSTNCSSLGTSVSLKWKSSRAEHFIPHPTSGKDRSWSWTKMIHLPPPNTIPFHPFVDESSLSSCGLIEGLVLCDEKTAGEAVFILVVIETACHYRPLRQKGTGCPETRRGDVHWSFIANGNLFDRRVARTVWHLLIPLELWPLPSHQGCKYNLAKWALSDLSCYKRFWHTAGQCNLDIL